MTGHPAEGPPSHFEEEFTLAAPDFASTKAPASPLSPWLVLRSVWTGAQSAATSSPIVMIGLLLFALILVVRVGRAIALGPVRKDPARLFSRSDKRVILARAGGRCEHHG
jgi:hypothetical protein